MPTRRARKKTTSGKSRTSSAKKSTTTKKRRTAAPRAGRKMNRAGSPRARSSGDFGVPADKPAQQRAASRRIKAQHPGERSESGDVQPRAGVESREAGVGGREAGPGSFSGGDIDPSITGAFSR
jgi:hypothetical protein